MIIFRSKPHFKKNPKESVIRIKLKKQLYFIYMMLIKLGTYKLEITSFQ